MSCSNCLLVFVQRSSFVVYQNPIETHAVFMRNKWCILYFMSYGSSVVFSVVTIQGFVFYLTSTSQVSACRGTYKIKSPVNKLPLDSVAWTYSSIVVIQS